MKSDDSTEQDVPLLDRHVTGKLKPRSIHQSGVSRRVVNGADVVYTADGRRVAVQQGRLDPIRLK